VPRVTSAGLVLPTFVNQPAQNAKEHLIALSDYIQLKNIFPAWHLQKIVSYSEMVSEMSSYRLTIALSGRVKTFKDFEKAFMERYWVEAAQTEVRYTAEGKKSYVKYLLEHTVKARYLQPSMSPSKFLGAIRGHYGP
jgi:hypothetical protein